MPVEITNIQVMPKRLKPRTDKRNKEKFLSEYEALCRKYQLIIDSQFDAMYIAVPEMVIDVIPRPIPGTGAREYENYEVKTQSIGNHILHLRQNTE